MSNNSSSPETQRHRAPVLGVQEGLVTIDVSQVPVMKNEVGYILVGEERFLEVEITAPESVLLERDPKGLYAAFAEGRITGLTGMDAPYESVPADALTIDTSDWTVDQAVAAILEAWDERRTP